MSSECNVTCNGKLVIFDTFLPENRFEQMNALYRFQLPFLGHPKYTNEWKYVDNQCYRNNRWEEASSPSSSIHDFKKRISDPKFITFILRDQLKMICLDVNEEDILRVQAFGVVLKDEGFEKPHIEKYFISDDEDEVFLKMIYYPHTIWKPEWNGHFEFWDNAHTKSCYEPLPNRLIVFVSDDQSIHGSTKVIQENIFVLEAYVKVRLLGK